MRGGKQLSVQGSKFKVQGPRFKIKKFQVPGSRFYSLLIARRSKVQSLRPVAVVQSAIRNPQSAIRSSAGFTLIEIMVVVFILGLLVTMVAPKIMGRTDEAKRTKAAADLRAIQQALNLYKLDNGRYPTTEQGLQALVIKPQVGVIPVRWNPEGYIEKVQLDPWENAYLYLSNGDRYTLKSLGGDGEEGGEGKDADLDSRDL